MTEAAPERLAKYLAHRGVASRRHAEELIRARVVTVNGAVVTDLATRILPEHDAVAVRGQLVAPPPATLTVALHKPVGYVATARDPQGRPIVADLLPPELRARRLVPVGRLDADSAGLLLLSDDGDLTLRLTHPRYGAAKTYLALVRGQPSDDALFRLRRGVVLAGDDPAPTAPASARRRSDLDAAPGTTWLEIILREGRKRQVRLMCAAIGAPVVELNRVAIGDLRLADVVPAPGQWAALSPQQIALALAGTTPR